MVGVVPQMDYREVLAGALYKKRERPLLRLLPFFARLSSVINGKIPLYTG